MTPSPPLTVPLRSRRRQQRLRRQERAKLVQALLQHGFPAAVLLFVGLRQLPDEPHGWGLVLAILEIVVGLLMLGSLVKSLHSHVTRGGHEAHSGPHTGIEWESLVAAAFVLVEGWEHRMHGGHHFPRPALLTAATLIVTGLVQGRIVRRVQARHQLRVSDEELHLPGLPFRTKTIRASWAQLASIEIGERWAVVTTRTGRARKLDLQDLDNAEEIRAALGEAQRRLAAYTP